MKNYVAIVHKDEGSAYGLSFPDLPGCFAAADDWSGVLVKAKEALDLYFEDSPEFEGRSLDQVRNDAEIQAELAEGAALIIVPHISTAGRSARVNITLDQGLLKAIDEAAREAKVTRSAFLASLARREISGY